MPPLPLRHPSRCQQAGCFHRSRQMELQRRRSLPCPPKAHCQSPARCWLRQKQTGFRQPPALRWRRRSRKLRSGAQALLRQPPRHCRHCAQRRLQRRLFLRFRKPTLPATQVARKGRNRPQAQRGEAPARRSGAHCPPPLQRECAQAPPWQNRQGANPLPLAVARPSGRGVPWLFSGRPYASGAMTSTPPM